MSDHPTRANLLLALTASLAAGCQPAVPPTPNPTSTSTLCYHSEFGSWTSFYQAPFATALVGMVSPLPETLVLTSAVAGTSYGRAYYAVIRQPADSTQAGGTWQQVRTDTLIIRLPSTTGDGLMIRLVGSGDRLQGVAWIYHERPLSADPVVLADPEPPTPSSHVTAARIQCPAARGSSPPGA